MQAKKTEALPVEEFVQNQIEKWQKLHPSDTEKKKDHIPVVTLSKEPGSGGCFIAEKVAQRLGFDFFHRDIIHKIAESAKISTAVVESLEKERLSGVQDFISSLVEEQYIHPNVYLEHLMRVIGTIGQHGRAVVIGRGANFIIPAEDRFAVRVIAPLEVRIQNVAKQFDVPIETAKKRVLVRENRRRAFIHQSFHADLSDPIHYDLVLNTGQLSVEAAVESIISAVMGSTAQSR